MLGIRTRAKAYLPYLGLIIITFILVISATRIFSTPQDDQTCGLSTPQYTSTTSTGEVYQWSDLRIGAGGFVTGLVIHPNQADLIYVRTDVGGLYRWQPEQKTWMQLLRSDTVSEKVSLSVESIAVAPSHPNIIYTAVGDYTQSNNKPKSGLILKSENQGQSWKILNLSLPVGGNEFWRWTGERLAVDPNNSNLVYFGSRLNGLWKSENGGNSWQQIDAQQVPFGESHPETQQQAGVSFVTFDPTSKTIEGRTQIIYVGVSGKGIYQTTNGGKTWQRLTNGPDSKLVPQQGVVNRKGELITTFYRGDQKGDGGVWKYHQNQWKNITPKSGRNYSAITVDPNQPDRIFVVTYPMTPEDIYRSTDGGKTWTTLKNQLDKLSWWPDWIFYNLTGAIAISPTEPDQVWLTNGIGVWKTANGSDNNLTWSATVNGIEETVAFDAVSLPGDPAVLTGIADFDGFRHESFCSVPKVSHGRGVFNTTTHLAYSFNNPNFVVSVGANHHEPDKIRAGFSKDSGKTWQNFASIENKTHPPELTFGNVAVSATNTQNIVWQPSDHKPPYYTTDGGKTWNKITFFEQNNLSTDIHTHLWNRQQVLAADSVRDGTFYIYHHAKGYFLRSEEGGKTWTIINQTLPGGAWNGANVKTAPGMAGEVWVSLKENGLYRSRNFGVDFVKVAKVEAAEMLTFGKAAPGINHPTVFIQGKVEGESGLFRSTDLGNTWVKLTDYPMGYLGYSMAIVGDMNVFGRVFMATTGNGFIYGQPVNSQQSTVTSEQ